MHTAAKAEEPLDEIEIEFARPDEIKTAKYIDPFDKPVSEMGYKVSRKLQKRFVGTGGAESKYIDPEQLNGYSVWDVVTPPYNLEYLAQIYDENPWLRSAIDARVMNTVGLGFSWKPTLKAKKQVERGMKSDNAAQKVRNSQQKEQDMLNELFDSFNEEETFIEVMIKIWLDALTEGTGYLEIGRTKTGKIGYLGHVPGKYTRMRRMRDGYVQIANNKAVFFRMFGDKETLDPINGDPQPNEMLAFKIHSPNSNYYGIPPSIAALQAIIGDKFAKDFNIDYFENKAIPRYAIVLKGVKLSEKSKKELIAYFRNEVKGKNHGTLVIPLPATLNNKEADVKFEKLETEVQEGSFDKYRQANRNEIVSVYRVPPTKVGIFEAANLAISRDADKTFKSQVVGPDQQIIEKRVNRIVKEFTDLFLMDLDSLDILDDDLKSRIHDRYARIGVESPNEIRKDISREPIPGGDKPLPYPIKTGYQSGNPWPSADALNPKPGLGAKGAPPGNDNAKSGSPPKSGQDNGSNKSNADETGTNAERGEVQTGG